MSITIGSTELLRQYVETISGLEEQRAELGEEIRKAYSAAKADGFEPKILKQIVKEMRMEEREKDEIDELNELLDVYRKALGLA